MGLQVLDGVQVSLITLLSCKLLSIAPTPQRAGKLCSHEQLTCNITARNPLFAPETCKIELTMFSEADKIKVRIEYEEMKAPYGAPFLPPSELHQ